MSDISLQEEQAKQWIRNVNEEIDQVKDVLNKANRALATVPTEDDTISIGIRNAAQTLENSWNNLNEVAKEVANIMDDVIKQVITKASELRDNIDSLVKKWL